MLDAPEKSRYDCTIGYSTSSEVRLKFFSGAALICLFLVIGLSPAFSQATGSASAIRADARPNEKQNEFLPLMGIGKARPGVNGILFIWSATDGQSTNKFRNVIWPVINSPKKDKILVIFMQTVTDFTESEINAAAPFFCGSKDQYDEISMRFLATGRAPERSPQCHAQPQGTPPQSSHPDVRAIMYASWYVLRNKYGEIRPPALIINGKYHDINSAEDALKYIR